jgi:hypothetical protein
MKAPQNFKLSREDMDKAEEDWEPLSQDEAEMGETKIIAGREIDSLFYDYKFNELREKKLKSLNYLDYGGIKAIRRNYETDYCKINELLQNKVKLFIKYKIQMNGTTNKFISLESVPSEVNSF